MLSGNGRHRRPRQAPAILVAAGVTGSAIAIPLLGATGASAASGTTWDAVAECESGGSWSADTGNGAYGGLQMTQETWEGFGGLDYAPSADQASRSQQIAVAEKVLAEQGTAAWATCGLVSGLTQDSGTAVIDTGVADGTTPSADAGAAQDKDGDGGKSDASTGDAAADEQEPDATATDDATPAPDGAEKSGKSGNSGKSSQKGDSSAEADSSGRHRGAVADEVDTATRADDYSARHASRSDSNSRVLVDEGSYVIRTGDSLSGIVESFELDGGWEALYDANKDAIGADPDFIIPGQSISIDN
ncbi:LysM peptidoglycan-binding domain-containing protein [Streptomyces apricus]|uniref:Peptigoglycan-binding protein LysM n=1 Tax=Streptomyces apricus TaxID=1828112 RepID=A0A5B0AKW1_9ACTN|nr:transglycosylase family protein [Streptomyces apricus]KAA0930603.1 peptigoglycan-binding protein LysM [Streptomyces apricus]